MLAHLCPFLLLTLTLCVVVPTNVAYSRDEDEPTPIFSLGKKPFVVLTVASLQRLKDEAEFLFEEAEYPDAVGAIMSSLDDNVGGLEGMDWEKPGGVMVFLNSVIPSSFEFVAYMPITSTEGFQTLMEPESPHKLHASF